MRSNRNEIIKDVLLALGAVGLVAVAIAAPNLVGVLGGHFTSRNKYKNVQIKRSLLGLEKRGFVNMSKEGDKTVISLTKDGKQKMLKYKIDSMKINPQKKWDHKWRLVIFDIPVDKSAARIEFTRKLKEIGFKLMQKSVWVCPYPCEDEIDFLKEVYEISLYVRVVVAEYIDIKNDLIRYFKLT